MKADKQSYQVFKKLSNKKLEEVKGIEFTSTEAALKWAQTYGEMLVSYVIKKKTA